MEILYLIIANSGDLWENDKASQQQTWAKETNETIIRYLYCTKDIKFNSANSMIVDCDDGYKFILKKTILGVEKAVNEINFDFMVRSNVSTYFDTIKLLNKLVYISQESPVALGYFEQHKKTYRLQMPNKLFVSGSAIILNHSAAKVLSGMDWQLYDSIPDDVAISHFLWTNKVALMHLSRNNYHITHFPISASIHRLKSSEFSHLTSERMKLLDNFNSANKIQSRVFSFLYMLKIELVNSIQNSTLFRDFAVRPSLHLQSRIRCRMALIQAKIDCV